jgi:methionine aminopeptidase
MQRMTADSGKEIEALKGIGHICAEMLRTADEAIAAQYEHTIVVRRGEPLVVTV